ncbi:MAG: alanine racemase, partial [Candidatus Gribaldobacteria bacterium]|nr:alanine racemase [Candidatus Gribaldobacteria bacterium]
MNSLSWVEVNTQNLKFNVQQVKKLLPAGFKIAGVVKGNAYGHGLLVVADYLAKNNLVDYLATANDLEALALRKQGIKLPIIVLSYWDISNLTQLIN